MTKAGAVVQDGDAELSGTDDRPSGVQPRAPRRRVVGVWLLVAALVGVFIPVAVAAATGNLAIPHNDAWSYSRIAQTFARTGHIQLLGWNRSALFGQFVVLGPLARWLTVQQVFVAITGLAALVAIYDLVMPSIGRKRAAFAVLIVAAWPGFGLLATSFMPDMPAMAAMASCLALGRRALRDDSTWLLAASIVFGIWGFTIREQALAAPAAVLLLVAASAWRSRRRRDWTVLIGAAVGFLVAIAVFELWRRSYNAGDPPKVLLPSSMLDRGTNAVVRGYFIVALGLSPAVLLVARPWRWGRGALLAAAAALVVAVAAVHDFRPSGFFIGNYLDPSGPYWGAGNGQPAQLFPTVLWWLVVALACGSGVLLAGLLVRRLPKLNPLLGVFLALMVLGNLGSTLSGQDLFDRYWLLVMPALLVVVLSERTPAGDSVLARVSGRMPAVVGWLALTVLSLAVTAAGLAYDVARWNAGNELVGSGVPAVDVNAGLEWNGYHSAIGMSPEGSGSFPGSKACYTVSAAPAPGRTASRVLTYRTFVIAGTSRLWIYDNGLPGCTVARLPR